MEKLRKSLAEISVGFRKVEEIFPGKVSTFCFITSLLKSGEFFTALTRLDKTVIRLVVCVTLHKDL